MNDHIAQFVKGAHLLTAGAIITLVLASIPTIIGVANLPSSPTEKIVGQVEVSSAAFKTISEEFGNLRKEVGGFIKSTKVEDKRLTVSRRNLARLKQH